MFYVYIMANKTNSVLYIGVTNNLERRALEHRNGLIEGFTQKYNLKKLVYFEIAPDAISAIRREKQLKNWHRDWKFNLISVINPNFEDLYQKFLNGLGDPETSSG